MIIFTVGLVEFCIQKVHNRNSQTVDGQESPPAEEFARVALDCNLRAPVYAIFHLPSLLFLIWLGSRFHYLQQPTTSIVLPGKPEQKRGRGLQGRAVSARTSLKTLCQRTKPFAAKAVSLCLRCLASTRKRCWCSLRRFCDKLPTSSSDSTSWPPIGIEKIHFEVKWSLVKTFRSKLWYDLFVYLVFLFTKLLFLQVKVRAGSFFLWSSSSRYKPILSSS